MIRIVLLAGIIGGLTVVPVWGHKVNVIAHIEGETIVVRADLGKQIKAVGCAVRVYDDKGTKVLEGKTDQEGTYSFNLKDLSPTNTDLKIVLEAPGGHRAHCILGRSELPDLTTLSRDPGRPDKERFPGEKSYEGAMQFQEPKIIKEAVAEVLESNLKPMTAMLLTQQRMLVELKQQGPSFRDVVGGIGWIMGLVGLAAYFLSRSHKG